jgi:hypothetical protein
MTDLVARQRIRDFVRMQNKPTSSQKQLSESSVANTPSDKCTIEDDACLAIYTQLLEDTKYALPFVPLLSDEDKKERLRNAYRACMISNEILKQLNSEAEIFTNIRSMRHKQTGHWMYFNRATGQEVDSDEYMDIYSDYIHESKVYYDADGGLDESYFEQGIDILGEESDIEDDDVLDPEEDFEEEEENDVDISSSSASSSSSCDSSHFNAENCEHTGLSGGEESPMIMTSSVPNGNGMQCRGQFPYRKRCSSTASNTDEGNSAFNEEYGSCNGSPGRSIREDRKRSKSLDDSDTKLLAQSLIHGSIWES